MQAAFRAPFRVPVYTAFWVCAFLSNLGTWIQDVAAGWVITHLSTSAQVIALLSFSNSLPLLLLSLPAGLIADLGYRRRILLCAQGLMFCAAAALAVLVWTGAVTQTSLLALSLLMGVGFALTNPAFQSVLTDLVPVSLQAQAVLAYYMGINIARVAGPAVGGGLIGSIGPASAFVLNSLSFLGLIIFFWKWPLQEAAGGATQGQVRSVDWQPLLSAAGLRLWAEVLLVTFCAAALWALYPTRGRIDLGLSSLQYGSLLAFLGLGACVSAVLSGKLLSPVRTRKGLGGAYLLYAFGMFLAGVAPNYPVLCAGMFFCGTGWVVMATLLNMSARQVTGTSPLRATMLGGFLAVFYAGMALGALCWGVLARIGQTNWALAAAGLALGLLGAVKMAERRQ